MSTGQVSVFSCLATAARILRRILLRATAPPSTLPTANPIRGPGKSWSVRARYRAVIFPEKVFFASWYTRWKSECFSSRERLGNPAEGLSVTRCNTNRNSLKKLLPEARLHGNALAPFRAATGEYRPAALCLHSGTKTVHLGTASTVRLKRALGH